MENRIKQLLLLLIIFTIAVKADAQTSEIDTIIYYDRTPHDFIIWIDTCIPPGFCEPLAVGFDLSPGFSFSLKELRVSFSGYGTFPYSIHQGIEWPSDSNKIYQDTIVVKSSERDSISDSLIVYKSILLEDKQELKNLEQKFWVVFDTKVYNIGNTITPPFNFSKHSFYKATTSASWDSLFCEWIVDAIVEKKTIGIKSDSNPDLFSGFKLNQNYPNPFNSITTITYEILHPGYVKLIIYDIHGREIMNLYNGYSNSGEYEVTWNGLNTEGKEVPSGIYFATLRFNKKSVRSMKLMLLK